MAAFYEIKAFALVEVELDLTLLFYQNSYKKVSFLKPHSTENHEVIGPRNAI